MVFKYNVYVYLFFLLRQLCYDVVVKFLIQMMFLLSMLLDVLELLTAVYSLCSYFEFWRYNVGYHFIVLKYQLWEVSISPGMGRELLELTL